MDFVFLPREKYEYHELHYTYTSDQYYKVDVRNSKGNFGFSFERVNLDIPYSHDSYDTLYQPYFADCEAYAAVENGEILGYIEIDREHWNSRLRITNLLVDEKHRGQGIGRFLVNEVSKIARCEDFRLIVLETQTCNTPAVDFYLSMGFTFAGTNLFFYSNVDIEEKEVMIEMVKFL